MVGGLGALALVPPQHQRAGDVDGRIGAGDDADEEGEGEVVDHAAAEKVERHRGEEHRAGGDDGAAQGLVERLIDDIAEAAANAELQVFPDTVEDDDGVVDGKADDGQHGGDHGGVEFAAGEAVAADGHQHVVQDGDDGTDGEGEFVAERHVNQDAEQREQ